MNSTDLVVVLILAVILFFGIRYTIKHFRGEGGCCGGNGKPKKVKASDRNKEHYSYMAEIQVEGMHCDNCKTRVQNAFNSHDGYLAEADVEAKCVRVWMKEKTEDSALQEMVRSGGYGAGSVQWKAA